MEIEDQGPGWDQQQQLEEQRQWEETVKNSGDLKMQQTDAEKEAHQRLDEVASNYADKFAHRGNDVWFKIYEAFVAGSEFGRKTVKACECGEVSVNYSYKCNS